MQTLLSILLAPLFFLGAFFATHPAPQSSVTIPASPAPQDIVSDLGASPYDIYNVDATEKAKLAFDQANGILGASNLIETPVALFHTSLANAISATANSMTLVSATTLDGTSLASSTYSFVLDSGTPSQEFVIADCTGTVCTNMQRGLSAVTGTTTVSSLEQPHRRTASVDIVDAPLLLKVASLLNGLTYFPNALYYSTNVSTSSLMNGNQQALASMAAVNYVGSTGCGNASTVTRGCSQFATALQMASSTQQGSTGALLIPWNALSTSTPLYSCDTSGAAGALCSIIALNDGKLSPLWLNGANENYILNGTTTLNNLLVTASSTFIGPVTHNATTTIAASSITSNALVLNGVPCQFPATQGASSTVLTTDGHCRLSYETPPVTIISATTTAAPTYTSNSTSTIYSITIPAGTWGGGANIAHFTSWWIGGGNCSTQIQYGNGSATTSVMGYALSNGIVSADIIATTTTSQLFESSYSNSSGNVITFMSGWSAVNSSVQTYLEIDEKSISSNNCTFLGYSLQSSHP